MHEATCPTSTAAGGSAAAVGTGRLMAANGFDVVPVADAPPVGAPLRALMILRVFITSSGARCQSPGSMPCTCSVVLYTRQDGTAVRGRRARMQPPCDR